MSQEKYQKLTFPMYFYNNLAQSASEEYIWWCEESLHGYSSQVCDDKVAVEQKKEEKQEQCGNGGLHIFISWM